MHVNGRIFLHGMRNISQSAIGELFVYDIATDAWIDPDPSSAGPDFSNYNYNEVAPLHDGERYIAFYDQYSSNFTTTTMIPEAAVGANPGVHR